MSTVVPPCCNDIARIEVAARTRSALSDNALHVLYIIAFDKGLTCHQLCNRPRSCGVRPGARTGTQRRADLTTFGVCRCQCPETEVRQSEFLNHDTCEELQRLRR